MNLMEHEVMGAPIGAEAAGEQEGYRELEEAARTKIIDAAPLMERLKAAIAFGNEKGLPTDELEQVLADIEGMEELPPVTPIRESGYWILGAQDRVNGIWAKCSACGKTSFGGGSFAESAARK